jgi:hypothetical protein
MEEIGCTFNEAAVQHHSKLLLDVANPDRVVEASMRPWLNTTVNKVTRSGSSALDSLQ